MKLIRNALLSFACLVIASPFTASPGYGGFGPRSPLKWDAFGQIPCAEEVVRVDHYGKELGKLPGTLAVVIIYAGYHDTRKGEVVARLFGIRDRLKTSSSIDPKRIVLLDGGFREKLNIQFWILPNQPLDSVRMLTSSEAPSEGVRLKMPRINKWEYKCRGNR